MSQVAIIGGGALVLMLCSSCLSSMLMMMGGNDTEGSSKSGGSTKSEKETTTKTPQTVKGRYVKLEQTVAYDAYASGNDDDINKIINLAELEVFDANGTNLASRMTVTGSSQHSSEFGFTNLTDGNKLNFAHTQGRTEEEIDYLQVDLGSVKEIKKIVITNRSDCCKSRAIDIKAVVLGADGTTVVEETPTITTEAATYTLTFPENVWS
jgi:hypothetical protein